MTDHEPSTGERPSRNRLTSSLARRHRLKVTKSATRSGCIVGRCMLPPGGSDETEG